MWKEALLLIAVIGYVTSVSGQVNEDDKAIDDAAGGSDNPVDAPLDKETDAAMDALANFMGFTCPKGHRCLPVLDCLPCDYGTYKDSESSELCKRCPPDCTTLRKGAQSKEECVPFCPPGYEISECGKTCTKCRPGTYKSTWEKTTLCVQCPAWSNPLADKLGMNSESECYDGDCPMYCLLPPSEESNLCSASVDQYFACLDVCSTDAANDLLQSYMILHSDIRSHLTPLLNNGDSWEYIYAWYLNECPDEEPTPGTPLTTQKTTTVETSLATCQSAPECGPAGDCYGGNCGCLTSTCSDLAYVAMPGCGYFCQCEITTQTWRLHNCSNHELFDERINNCNWNFSVAEDLCFSTVNCDLDTCPPPSSAELCSIDTRTYMTCLRSLYVQCGRHPTDELASAANLRDTVLYRDLVDLVEPVETVADMESVYYGYMYRCLAVTDV